MLNCPPSPEDGDSHGHILIKTISERSCELVRCLLTKDNMNKSCSLFDATPPPGTQHQRTRAPSANLEV